MISPQPTVPKSQPQQKPHEAKGPVQQPVIEKQMPQPSSSHVFKQPIQENKNVQESFKHKLNELKIQTAQMIKRGEKEKETKSNIEIPMEIDEIKGVGQSYGNINQLPEELDHQMEEEV